MCEVAFPANQGMLRLKPSEVLVSEYGASLHAANVICTRWIFRLFRSPGQAIVQHRKSIKSLQGFVQYLNVLSALRAARVWLGNREETCVMICPLGHGIGQAISPQVDVVIHFHDEVRVKLGSDELQENQCLCGQAGIGFLQKSSFSFTCSNWSAC